MGPLFMWFKLLQLRRPIMWVDCDLEVVGRPTQLLSANLDFAAVNNKPFWKHTMWDGVSMVASSGVLMFNSTRSGLGLLEEWIRTIQYQTNTKAPDDKQLDAVFDKRWSRRLDARNLRLTWLPRAYLQWYRRNDATVVLHRGSLSRKKHQVMQRTPPDPFYSGLPSARLLSLTEENGYLQPLEVRRVSVEGDLEGMDDPYEDLDSE